VEIAHGNSFNLGNGQSICLAALHLEGALALGPGLHLFDTSAFQKLGNAF
jgi:hypothetical protein